MPGPVHNHSFVAQAVRQMGNDQKHRLERGQPASGQHHAQRAVPRQVSNQPVWTCHAVLAVMTLGTLASLNTVGNAAPRVDARPRPPQRPHLQAALSPQHGGAQRTDSRFFGPELAAGPLMLPHAENGASAFGILGHLADYWFANPCTDPDTAINGGWKALHPVGKRVTTRFTEIQKQQALEAITWLEAPARATDSEAQRALASTWASAHAPSPGWSAFSAQSAALDLLADQADVEQRLSTAMVEGKSPLLELEHVFGQSFLNVAPALPPGTTEQIYALADDAPDVNAHLATIAALLADTGLPQDQCSSAAATCHAMGKTLSQSAWGMDRLDLDGAKARVPAFPWGVLWPALGLNDSTALYINTGAFQALGDLLASHPSEDWKHFLRYQEALHAQPFISASRDAHWLEQLDQPDVGRAAFTALYAEHFAPERARLAEDMLATIVAEFKVDLRRSALDAADQLRMCTALDSLRLHLGKTDAARTWDGISPDAAYLTNIHALRAANLQHGLQSLRQGTQAWSEMKNTHHLYAAVNCEDGMMVVTRATINGVLETFGDTLEGRWATLGTMLGHEVAHCLTRVEGLSADAERLLSQRTEAVRQRVENLSLPGPALNASRVAEEAACDLSGLATARRAGRAEAQSQAREFNDALFLQKAAQLHAANPSPSQRIQLNAGSHPPPAARAALVREVAGYEAAYGCDPAPRAPFDHVL